MAAKTPFSLFLKYAVLILCSVIVAVNAVGLGRELGSVNKIRRVMPFYFPGMKFAGLESFFEGTMRVGFYTDKNIKQDETAMVFAQAQLVLAPVILELDNLNRRYIIFDCADEQHALNKIMEIGARPIKKKGGLILAERGQP